MQVAVITGPRQARVEHRPVPHASGDPEAWELG